MKFLFFFILIFSICAMGSTSEQNRLGKKMEATLQLASQDYRLPNLALAGMYFLTPNDLLGLKIGSLLGKENQDSLAIQYKRYFGNSFILPLSSFTYVLTRESMDLEKLYFRM